jgi:prepilin-type N-terminal cleavage/methylation domain-containing protein/prepilin-type processing-associated H-X9-DG protein
MSRRSSCPGRHPGGFTLVELLVVIGLIAMLISLLLPTLTRAREQGKQVACQSNLRQLGMAMQMYCHDNQDYFPRAGITGSSGNTFSSVCIWVGKAGSEFPYSTAGADVRYLNRYLGGRHRAADSVPVAHCPSDPLDGGYYDRYGTSYGSNSDPGAPSLLQFLPPGDPRWFDAPIKAAQVHHSSSFVMAAEHAANVWVWNNGQGFVQYLHWPHAHRWNALFGDGHVASPEFQLGTRTTSDYDYRSD